MKICVVGSSKRFFSGITAHTIFLANALAKENEVCVILLRKLLPEFLYPGQKHLRRDDYLIDFADGVDVYDGMDWNSPLTWLRAYQFLKRHKPDAIIMPWWTSSVAHMQLFLVWANKLKIGAKLILEMHETVDPLEERILPIRLYAKVASRLLMRAADAFTAHSTSVREQIAQTYGISKDKIFVKPIGLYEDYKRDHDRALAKRELGVEEQFVILSFGSIRKYKGVPYLVKAFSALPETVANNSILIIAGEDWGEENELDKLIESSPYRQRIIFNPSFVPDYMLPIYFSAADVVVLPYLRTCGSGIAHIAMVYGKAIITSDIEPMRELLEGYQGARFTSAGDSSAIKEKLLEVYERQKLEGVPLYSIPRNTWDKIAIGYREIMERL